MAPDILDPAIQPEDKSETGHKVKQRIIKNVKFQTDSTSNSQTSDTQNKEFKSEIRWLDLLAQVFVHAGFLYGGYYLITLKAKLFTYIWSE